MNPQTSPGKTGTVVQVLGEEMRSIVAAEPSAPWANKTSHIGPLYVTLSRFGRDWSLSLFDESPISDETCAAWSAAVGAPKAEWRLTENRLCARCEWVGVGEDAPAVMGTPLFGGSHVRR